jgi:hypothetical protein
MVLLSLICCVRLSVIVRGGVRLEEYGKCIMHFGVGLGIEYFFSFTVTCHRNLFVIIVVSILRHPCAPPIIS